MRFIILLLVNCSMLLFTVSCQKDYLNANPEHVQNANNFFQSKNDFVQAVNGAYAPLRPLFTDSFWQLGEMRSDNTSFQYNLGDRSAFVREQIDEFLELDDNPFVYSFFSNAFIGIGRCNVILDRFDRQKIGDETAANAILGQAKFLRSYYYFNLVQLFGEVPLMLHEPGSTDDAFANATRKPIAEIHEAIIADAKEAIANLPEKYEDPNDLGRATSISAHMLLAKVYMVQQKFDLALAELLPIINSEKSLYPDYASNFNPNSKNGQESIFEVQFLEGPFGLSSNFMYTFAPYNGGTTITGFGLYPGADSGWNIPTYDLMNSFEDGDVRFEKSIENTFSDPNTKQILPYVIKFRSAHAVRYQTNQNFPVYRYADALLMAAECLNEGGYMANGDAFRYVNQVRNRAGLPDLSASQAADQTAFREAVWKERMIELAFENHRWFDLLRTGRAERVLTEHAVRERAKKSHIPAGAFQNISLVFPYPRREVLLIP